MIIKIAFLCTGILAATATAPVGIAVHNTGVSSTSKHQDSHGNYAFEYDIVDEHGASNSRSEAGDAFGNKKGSYSLYDTDGRARRVDYIADEHGFRVVVNTNEPGTAQSYPAGAIINSPYQEPASPIAAPVSIVHEVPIPVSGHVTPVSRPIKSAISHAAPTVTFDYAAPVGVAHTIPSGYSTKSVISHDSPVSIARPIAVPYVHTSPLAYSGKSVVSHATAPIAIAHSAPLVISPKSVLSHVTPAHAPPVAITRPEYVSYSPKSVISSAVPIAKHYVPAPATVSQYKSIYNGDLGFNNFGYSHGLLGTRFGALSYNTKLYNDILQRHGLRGLLHNNEYDHGYYGYGYGILGPNMRGLTYGNSIYGYDGMKSYYH